MGGVVLSPITHAAISEWSRTFSVPLEAWEVAAVRLVDDVWLDVQRQRVEKMHEESRRKQPSGRPR